MKTAYRSRMLACYTRFVLVTIYVCRSRGSTKRVFPQAVSLPLAIFNIKSFIMRSPCHNAQALFKNKTFSIKIKLWKKISLKMNPSKMNSLL